LTDEMKSWLVANKQCVYMGISLDGNKTAHDLNRSNSYDRVRENLPFFMEHWPDQPVKMTISAETIPHVADSIIDLEELGVLFSANVVFENIWGTPEQKAELLETYRQQLERLVEYYLCHPDLVPATLLNRRVEMINVGRPAGEECIRWCGAGHEMMVIGVDGGRYPCHRFMPWVTAREVPTGPVNHQASWRPEMCTNCRLVALCPTCAGYNWQENGDSGLRSTYHCEAFKLEVLASARLQALRLLQRQPEELVNLSSDELYQTKLRLDAILDFAEHGI